MRNIMLFGAAAIALTLSAASASAMGGGNLSPEQSPYAVIAPQTLQQSPMQEGRSAYTGDDSGYSSSYGVQPGYDAPQTLTTPEDRNYYSRGR
ncbi:hypothetical protein [Methylocapsa sp. S129]|uniref:hypothetical protein n=1 Tax=Methylocapsa sp. S129 TaxID=1641869 RepID=UPI00131AB0A3|nr:hypothetical protein [Methylocapsa sp. S129]